MILTTHALVGAAVASTVPEHPVLGFILGFGSHFLLDAIPHWEYHLGSIVEDKGDPLNTNMHINAKFLIDLLKVGFDAVLGLGLSIFIFSSSTPLVPILAGAIGGMLPDPLQFAYWKLRVEPLISLQKFHTWIHANKKLNHRPVLGISLQILVILAIIGTVAVLKS